MKLSNFFALIIAGSLTACGNTQEASDVSVYFDIRGFFNTEASKLQKANQAILKTVVQNESQEQKQLMITDWKKELDLFIQSDINKPSWVKSYRMVKNDTAITYTAIDKDLRTQKITVVLKAGKVKHIQILNEVNNLLYAAAEELNYYPDSLYSITNRQRVTVLGSSHYLITGKIRY